MVKSIGSARERAVARAILRFAKSKRFAKTGYDDEAEDPSSDADRYPFGFVVAVLFDQMMRAERAWAVPGMLKRRLGHLDPRRIGAMSLASLVRQIRRRPALHRYPARVGDWLKSTSSYISDVYGSRPRLLWSDRPSAAEMEKRFDALKGFGQKKSSMAVNILVRDYGVLISGSKRGIDVSNNAHVRRVFLRAGLINVGTEAQVLLAARKLNPEYPGALDLPAWKIGRTWCTESTPDCTACAIGQECPQFIGRSAR